MIAGIIAFSLIIIAGCAIEAFYLDLRYHVNNYNNEQKKIIIDYPYRGSGDFHRFFLPLRGAAYIIASYLYYKEHGIEYCLLYIAALSTWFFFIQGFLYWFRHMLNWREYTKGFWSEPSKTSTAMWDFSKNMRIFFAVISIIVFTCLQMFL